MPLSRQLAYLGVPAGDPELARAQFFAYSTQLPVLYAILLINAVGLAVTHLAVAPLLLTTVTPTVLCVVCIARVAFWLRGARDDITGEEAAKRLRATFPLVGVLGVAFTTWSLSLYPYGDDFMKFHVAFYMSITVISCIFCLMHLLSAALLLSVIVIVPFTIFFCSTGHLVFTAIALNFALACCGMMFILLRNYRDFAKLVLSRKELAARQAETEKLNQENSRLANLDMLSGLPNRRFFLASLDRTLGAARADGTRFALVLIDLDGFKGVNDAYGHASGDRLLAEVGERLSALASNTVLCARLGGDEFGIILGGDPDHAAVVAFGEMVCRQLRGPYLASTIRADVTGSAGLAAYPNSGESAEQLFERADYALYHAKEYSTGQAVIFTCEHEVMIREAASVERGLRKADLEKEISVVFQPIVDVGNGSTLGFEALARWDSPELGEVGPERFIAAAERMRGMGRLTPILLSKTLCAASTWPENLRISFNLSAQDLASPDTITSICAIITASGVNPARIDLEITETAVMRDFNQARAALATLHALGARISLDDFGTGFSSLSQVHRLKLDKIKIDRSFVADILVSPTSCDLVKTIVGLCRSLDLGCIVEGVETEAQKRRLITLGCRYMQGYLFSRPMPASSVVPYLEGATENRATA